MIHTRNSKDEELDQPARGIALENARPRLIAANHPIFSSISHSAFGGLTIFTGDKIKELCARVIAAEGEEFEAAIAELRTFMREHSEALHNRTLATVLTFPQPVRKKDGTEG